MNSGGRSLAGREALRRWGPLAAAALLLALAAAGAAFGSLQIGRVQLPAAPEDGSPSGTSTTEAPQSDLPSPAPGRPSQLQVPAWLTTLVGVLCGLAVAAIVGLLLWYLIRT